MDDDTIIISRDALEEIETEADRNEEGAANEDNAYPRGILKGKANGLRRAAHLIREHEQ